jgi:ketosteroid isomerase-like protein
MGTLRDLNQQGAKDYNNGDLDAMAKLYSRDAVLVSPDGRFEGIDAIRKQWADQMAAFPGAQIEYIREIEQGDTIVTEFVFRGTNSGPLALPDGSELPATGKAIELDGVVVATVVGDKIVSETMYYDNMKAYGDLGLLPS